MKTVFITGVTGFIGRYVARHFHENGWQVVGLGTRPPENAPIQILKEYQNLILPSEDLLVFIQRWKPDVCIHCAGRASVNFSLNNPGADFDASLKVTFQLLNSLRLHQQSCRLIYLSSAAVYGNPQILPICEVHQPDPISPYGFHKLMCEQICKEFYKVYKIPTAIARIFSAYGPGLRRQVMWDICRKALTQPVLELYGTGDESRDFIHVRDVARCLYLLAEQAPCEGEIYNLASGNELTVRELATLLLNKIMIQIPTEFNGEISQGNPTNWRADVTKISQLGYKPEVPLERGVNIYAQWCRAEVLGW